MMMIGTFLQEKGKEYYIDKIYYIRYGNRWDKNYFKIGALDNVTMGYGILINRYTNTLLYPQVRKVGMEFKTRAFGVNIHGFTNDFKENMGLAGLRISAPVDYGITAGLSWVGDRNQYLGLRDRDGDGRPDLVDDFPNNNDWWVDTDGDGWADNDTLNEFDVDGDGWTDSSFTFPLFGIVIDPDGVETKPEPINIKEESESFNAFSIDLGMPVVREGPVSVDAYSQYAAFLGYTKDPISGKRNVQDMELFRWDYLQDLVRQNSILNLGWFLRVTLNLVILIGPMRLREQRSKALVEIRNHCDQGSEIGYLW